MASSKELELAVKIAGKLDASYGNALSGAAKQANAWSKTAQKAAQIATAAFAAVGTATAAATVASVKMPYPTKAAWQTWQRWLMG